MIQFRLFLPYSALSYISALSLENMYISIHFYSILSYFAFLNFFCQGITHMNRSRAAGDVLVFKYVNILDTIILYMMKTDDMI